MWNHSEATSKLNSGGKYLHPYISVNFEIINEAVKCSNTTHIQTMYKPVYASTILCKINKKTKTTNTHNIESNTTNSLKHLLNTG